MFFFSFQIPIVSKRECLNTYPKYYITRNMFCAGFRGGRIDSCAGDSGGPLLCETGAGQWTIYGVTSFGEGCGQEGKFGIYAQVPNYVHWIDQIINYRDPSPSSSSLPTEMRRGRRRDRR